MAQYRRFGGQDGVAGDYPHNDFWGRGSVLGKGGKMPKFPGATGVMDADSRRINTRCNNSDKSSDSDIRHACGAQYKPNTSRRRELHAWERRLCVGKCDDIMEFVQKASSQSERVELTGRKLWDLGSALLFEMLMLLLLVSVTSVQVSAALAEGIGWWLDKGMLGMLRTSVGMLRIAELERHKKG